MNIYALVLATALTFAYKRMKGCWPIKPAPLLHTSLPTFPILRPNLLQLEDRPAEAGILQWSQRRTGCDNQAVILAVNRGGLV